jgi:hypothetical protein
MIDAASDCGAPTAIEEHLQSSFANFFLSADEIVALTCQELLDRVDGEAKKSNAWRLVDHGEDDIDHRR